jgi:hypothetical protein
LSKLPTLFRDKLGAWGAGRTRFVIQELQHCKLDLAGVHPSLKDNSFATLLLQPLAISLSACGTADIKQQ